MAEVTTLLYSLVGGTVIFGLILMVFAIAGKSIFFEFYRRILPKGNDIFMLSSNRQLTQYYKVPKDNQFMIQGKPYITNPDKPGEFCYLWGEYAIVAGDTQALPEFTPLPSPTATNTPTPSNTPTPTYTPSPTP